MTIQLQQVSALHNLDLDVPQLNIRGILSHGQRSFLDRHPEGIVLNESLRAQIQMAIEYQDLPVIIEGETGTGKEQIVQLIHRQLSRKSEMPLVVINCASLQGDLAASTLFGHKKGAFTGAHTNHIGAIAQAHRGILFLDEFHRLPTPAQEQLLRSLQDGSYQRVGETTERHSDFRLIVATPKNIEEHALGGDILIDLRFRLYGVEITIPPLRHRLEQLEDFIDCFLTQQGVTPAISHEQKQRLIQRCSEFYWQGNIRQLFGILQSLCVKARVNKKPVLAEDLPIHPTMYPPTSHQRSVDDTVTLPRLAGKASERNSNDCKLIELIRKYMEQPYAYDNFLQTLEREMMRSLWTRFNSVKDLCHATQLPRSTLYSKRQRLGISDIEPSDES